MDKRMIVEAKQKLVEMNDIVSNLDPSVRAAAFEILKPFYFEGTPPDAPDASEKRSVKKKKTTTTTTTNQSSVAPDDETEFFDLYEHLKPSDNLLMIVAWLYHNHGVIPMTTGMIADYAKRIGLTVPSRSDNTMRQAKVKGKGLFKQQGKEWFLTVSGENYMKGNYHVRKGNAPVEQEHGE